MKNYDSVVWNYVNEHLSAPIRTLVQQANYDLHYGPGGELAEDESYPGFVSACQRIREALDDFQDLWIDMQAEIVETSEPDWNDDGFCQDDYVLYTHKDIMRAYLGSALAEHA